MNCARGDLAIVIRSDFQKNIGAIVEIVDFGKRLDQWQVRITGRPLMGYDTLSGEIVSSASYQGPCYACDAELRPIKGLRPDELDEIACQQRVSA